MLAQRIILIGQAPGSRSDPKEPLSGASGRRLATLAGMGLEDFLERFERVNLAEAWPGGGPHKGDGFDLRAARDRADELRMEWAGRKAVLLGRGVAAAFRLVPDDYDWFQPIEVHPGIEMAVIPHPSGISQWWNEPENMRRARDFMLALKVGFFEFRRIEPRRTEGGGRREMFTPAQIAAALEAGRGVNTWAAEALAEATGIRVNSQTIANYVDRYPELALVEAEQLNYILSIAKRNIIRDIEAGGVDSSWKLLRSRVGQGSGYELVVNAKIEGRFSHSGHVSHDHVHRRAEELTDLEAVAEWRRLTKPGSDSPVN